MTLRDIVSRVRARCGELWWWSALMFLSCRAGDAINAFIGLWLVPRYVGGGELGATLPLIYLAPVFGLPIAILNVPFSRWLTLYSARGEFGKVKRMLRFVLGGVAIAFALAVLAAKFILPLFFERLRVAEGSLGFLLVCSGLITPCCSTFTNALQGLKRFGAYAVVNVIGAPVRLVTMLAAMPFRALSGYLLGHISPPAASIAVSAFSLRRELGGTVKSEPIGREDFRAMLRYTAPIVVYIILSTVLSAWQMLLVRQRLPEVESAAFYILSRLAEVAAYAGYSIVIVVFPLAAEAGEKGGGEMIRLVKRLLIGTIMPGAALTILFAFTARHLMNLVGVWSAYQSYSHLLWVYSLRSTLYAASLAFATCETGAGNFRFLWYWVPLTILETVGLVALTGYGAFRGILPDAVVDWMQALDAASISFFLHWLVVSAILMMTAIAIHIALKHSALKRRYRGKSINQ